jgi:hypothetical protein
MTHLDTTVPAAAPEPASQAGEASATSVSRAARAEAWIRRDKIVAIVRMTDADRAVRACREPVSVGVTVVKITADHPLVGRRPQAAAGRPGTARRRHSARRGYRGGGG